MADLLFLEHLPLEELKCFNQCAALEERDNYSHFYRVRIWERLKCLFWNCKQLYGKEMNWAFLLKSILPACFGCLQGRPLGIPAEMLSLLRFWKGESGMSLPQGPSISSQLRCPLLIACLYAFAADDRMVINEEKKNRFIWTVPLSQDLNSSCAGLLLESTRRQSSCNAFFNTCMEQSDSRSCLKQDGSDLILLSSSWLLVF